MPPIRKTLIPVLVLLAFALAACGSDNGDETSTSVETTTTAESDGSAPSSGGNAAAPSGEAVRSEKIEIVDFSYDPDPVTIQAGGKVIWMNRDSASHTATADDGAFDTGTIEEGKLGSKVLKQPGTYAYHCTIHPSMHGTIDVVEPS